MADGIDEQQVRHISHLARLRLSDSEIARFGAELREILNYVDQLGEVNTDGVEPMAHPLPIVNVFREDSPKASLGSEHVLSNAPVSAPPYFKVPKVLDQDSA